MHYAKWKKSISKGYMLYDSVYLMTFWKKANGRTATLYFRLGKSRDRGAWQATVHGGAKESEMAQQLNNRTVTQVTQLLGSVATRGYRLREGSVTKGQFEEMF